MYSTSQLKKRFCDICSVHVSISDFLLLLCSIPAHEHLASYLSPFFCAHGVVSSSLTTVKDALPAGWEEGRFTVVSVQNTQLILALFLLIIVYFP